MSITPPTTHPSHPIAIRPATLADLDAISALISADARRGGLLPRSPESIRAAIDNFLVAEWEVEPSLQVGSTHTVIGCGALAPMSPSLVELRSLAVHPSARLRQPAAPR